MTKIVMGIVGVGINILLLPMGQLFWKKALVDGYNVRVFVSNSFLMGALCYVMGTVFWLFALSIFPLSKIYPFISLSYIIGAGFGIVFFKEQLSALNIIGYLVLIGALFLISWK